MVAVLKSAPTLPDNNTATHMAVAVLFGRVAQHTPKIQQKPFSRRLSTVFDRFSDRRDSGNRPKNQALARFSPAVRRQKTGKTAKTVPFPIRTQLTLL